MVRVTKILVIVLLAVFGVFSSFIISEAADTTPPSVTIVFYPPSAGADELITITAAASDRDSQISIIKIYVDNGLVRQCFNVQTCTHPDTFLVGDHLIYAEATSEGGTSQSSSKTFTITDTTPPDSVTATHSPASPAQGQSVKIAVSGTDSQSAVTQTQVYVDDVLKKTCGSASCYYTSTYSAGQHTYYGKATSGGGTSQSDTVTLTIPLPQPTVIRSGQGMWGSQGNEYDLDATSQQLAQNPESGDSDMRLDSKSPTQRRIAHRSAARFAVTGVDANSDCTIPSYAQDESPTIITKGTTWPANYYFCVRTNPATDVFKYYLVNYHAKDSPPDLFDWQEHEKPAVCGNGLIETGEQCDDGNTDDSDACVGCQDAYCGDGFFWENVEDCEDGNTNSGDGCSASCTIEICGNGVQEGGEECDDGNNINADSCTNICTLPACGDGLIQLSNGEECDGTNLAGSSCSDVDPAKPRGNLNCDAVTCNYDVSECLASECTPGETSPCTIPTLNGECAKSTRTCNAFSGWGSCSQVNQPATETCDGLDNDCDGQTDDGDNLCTLDNAAAACVSGSCQVASCSADYDDCDSSAANGCEINLQTDLSNCGVCGNVCIDKTFADKSCLSGTCEYSCQPGHYDLNGDGSCEYACTPTASPTEVCDGADNDCDGTIDVKLSAKININEFDQDGDYWTTCGSNTLSGQMAPLDASGQQIVDCDDDLSDDADQQRENPLRPAADKINPDPDTNDPVWDGVDNNCDGLTDASITISKPLAGVEWIAGTPQLIEWTARNVYAVELTYSTNANAGCEGETIATENTACAYGSWLCLFESIVQSAETMSQEIAAPDESSNTARVRVEGHDASDPATVIGNKCSDAFTITPDSELPTVSITSPQDGDTVVGTIIVTADATDNVGVQSVTFITDTGTSVDIAPPYEASFDTTTVVNGEHVINAVVKDIVGNENAADAVTIIVDNQVAECAAGETECTAAGSPVEPGKVRTCGIDNMWEAEVDCTTTDANAYAICSAGACGSSCQAGFIDENGVCVTSDITCTDNGVDYAVNEKICTTGTPLKSKLCDDINGVGTWREETCATDANGATTCAEGICALECDQGYEFDVDAESCEPVACTVADWTCTDWTPEPCTAGQQTRTCELKASANCATNDGKVEAQACAFSTCGDGILDASEGCDDGNVIDQDGCSGGCTREYCGNGALEWKMGEQCDGASLNGKGCTTVGGTFTGGTLACSTDCTFDTSACTGAACTESWTCTDWTPEPCTAGQQTRVCTDANNCGTTATKPSVGRDCIAETEIEVITQTVELATGSKFDYRTETDYLEFTDASTKADGTLDITFTALNNAVLIEPEKLSDCIISMNFNPASHPKAVTYNARPDAFKFLCTVTGRTQNGESIVDAFGSHFHDPVIILASSNLAKITYTYPAVGYGSRIGLGRNEENEVSFLDLIGRPSFKFKFDYAERTDGKLDITVTSLDGGSVATDTSETICKALYENSPNRYSAASTYVASTSDVKTHCLKRGDGGYVLLRFGPVSEAGQADYDYVTQTGKVRGVTRPPACTTSTDCTAPAHGTAACVSESCVTTCDQGYELRNGVCVVVGEVACSDTDGGTNGFVKGTCTDSSGVYADYCERPEVVIEYGCEASGCVAIQTTTDEPGFTCVGGVWTAEECTKTPGQETRETTCDDNLDNDCDRNKDAADRDCAPAPACGNSAVEGAEECDETDLASKTCATYKTGSKFTGGTLKCNPACKFDVGDCFVEEIKTFAGVAWEAGHEEVGELEAGSVIREYRVKIGARTENPSLTFRTLESKPEAAPAADNVFKFVQVDINMPESAVESARLKFAVDKFWVLDNEIDKKKVRLNRLESGVWKQYDTTIVSEAGAFVLYEATLPGLSLFSVTGEKISAPVARQPEPTPQPTGGGGFETRAVYKAGSTLKQAIAAPALGNGKCETGENSQNACSDCGCGSAAYECVSNKCVLTEQLDAGVVPESNVPENIVEQSSKLRLPRLPWQANVVFAAVLLALLGVLAHRFYLKPRMLGPIAEAHDAHEPGPIENAKSFIAHALAEGHSMSDVKAHLIASGWSSDKVEAAISESSEDLTDLQNLAIENGVQYPHDDLSYLRAYLKDGLAKGYTKAQIKAVVLSNGWPEEVVNRVLR